MTPDDNKNHNMPRVVFAASLGTVFEYYDFMLYGSLAAFFSGLFFPANNPTASLLASLATFGAGFAMRPVGALLFGRMGDTVGRKRSFLITIVIMGLSTTLVGLLPTYETIGWLAPVLLVTLRLLQGLALGGEFGGATLYIAEHSPPERRGWFTAWIQTTGTMGLILSLLVILACRAALGDDEFRAWGWRLPFLFSVVLLAVSVYIRLRLKESPLFARIQASGELSRAPIRDSVLAAENRRPMLLALAAAAAMALNWYAAQFYSYVFLQSTVKMDFGAAATIAIVALTLGIPLFLAAGRWSDRVGRMPPMLLGMALSAASFLPGYSLLMANNGSPALQVASILMMIVGAALTCAPGAAYLAELFPTRIRYTSLSFPYHITSAWFGGFMPLTATWLVSSTGNPLAGVWYPTVISAVCLLLLLAGGAWRREQTAQAWRQPL
jgi:MFS family permease